MVETHPVFALVPVKNTYDRVHERIEHLRRQKDSLVMVGTPLFRSVVKSDLPQVVELIHPWYHEVGTPFYAEKRISAQAIKEHEQVLLDHIEAATELEEQNRTSHYFVCEAVCFNRNTAELEQRVIGVMGYTHEIDNQIKDVLAQNQIQLDRNDGGGRIPVCELRSLYFDLRIKKGDKYGVPVGKLLFWHTVEQAYRAGYRRATLIKGALWDGAEEIYKHAPGFNRIGTYPRPSGIDATIYVADLDTYQAAESEKNEPIWSSTRQRVNVEDDIPL